MQSYRKYQQVMRLPCVQTKHNQSGVKSDKAIKKNDISDSTLAQQRRRKITRTKTGCFCCRKRKKKCDEMKPACSGCTRNNLKCVYPEIHNHQQEKMAAFILSEMASHNDVPQMTSPSSPHHSDIESPITSPRLDPHESIKMILPLSMDTVLSQRKRDHTSTVQKTCISVKSLLN